MNRPQRANYRFRLFIAGDAQNSVMALANLGTLCRLHLLDQCDVEVVDVFKHPGRALEEGVFMTPTLIKLSPAPLRRIVGSLYSTDVVLQALGVGPLTT